MISRLQQAGVLDTLDVHLAQRLAALSGDTPALVRLAIALACRAPRVGDVAADLAHLDAAVFQGLLPDGPPAPEAWRAALSAHPALFRRPDATHVTPLVLSGALVYLDRAWRNEQDLVASLASRLSAAPEDIRPAPDLTGFGPDKDHLAAAASAVSQRLTVVTGGPGTGKTTLAARVIAHLSSQTTGSPPRVLCVAPTGKAAARLTASLRAAAPSGAIMPEALTVHRALGLHPKIGFRRHHDAPLDADWVLVDEASMIDLPLMVALFDAIPPPARVMLMGDPDQLASVEHGAVLADMLAAIGPPHHVNLGTPHRYAAGSGISALARAIQSGDAEAALAVLDDAAKPDVTLIPTPTDADLDAHLRPLTVDAFSDLATLPPADALRRLAALRVLAPHRDGSRGVSGLVSRIGDWLRAAGAIAGDATGYAGQPLMIRQNDATLGVFNGDVAVLGHDGRAWLPSGTAAPRALQATSLPPAETLYASTVHKSQGSEHAHVVLVLPAHVSPLCTRELVYTAVTRATGRVTVLGDRAVLSHAITHRTRRVSGITAQLRSAVHAARQATR